MAVSKKRKYIEKEIPEWLERNKARYFVRSVEKLESVPDNGNKADLRMVAIQLENMQMWYMNKFTESGLSGSPDYGILALDTRYWLTEFLLEEADYGSRPGNPGGFLAESFGFLLSTLIAIGWREQAEMVARIGLTRLDTFLGEGISPNKFPWFMLHLAKEWLKSDIKVESKWSKIYIDGLGFWETLLAGWQNTDLYQFTKLFNEAADFHVSESSYLAAKDVDHKRDPEMHLQSYWLFPVELFAVLRLREWQGLPNPPLDHPLFTGSALGQMPPMLAWPDDKLLNEVERKIRKAFPEMRPLENLPQ